MDKKMRKIIWLIISVIVFGYFYIGLNENSCVSKTETRTVRGNSMAGLIDEGREVKIIYGYYDCNPIQKGDVVVYQYPSNPNPIIKMVWGVPGDNFGINPSALADSGTSPQSREGNFPSSSEEGSRSDEGEVENKRNENKYQIFVNNQLLANTSNQPHLLDDQEAKMLQLYEKDYQGKIPPDTYLILGNITYGSLDSTKFGLVGKEDILGKVIY